MSTIEDRIEAIEAEIAKVRAELEAAKEPEWKPAPGEWVEVRQKSQEPWMVRRVIWGVDGEAEVRCLAAYDEGPSLPYPECRPLSEESGLVQWRDHDGGECPVPVGTPVIVEHRDGFRAGFIVSDPDWTHDGSESDIMRYIAVDPRKEA